MNKTEENAESELRHYVRDVLMVIVPLAIAYVVMYAVMVGF